MRSSHEGAVMRDVTKLLAIMTVLVIAIVPFVAADDSDATVKRTGQWEASGFTDNGGGSLKCTIQNDDNVQVTIRLKVLDFNDESRVLATKDVAVPASTDNEGKTVAELNWSYDSSGTKYVKVYSYNPDTDERLNNLLIDDGCVQIEVSHSIWKNSATYIVIVIIVIVVIVALVLYMRTTKKTKADTTMADRTFTRMHEDKVAKKSGAAKKTEYRSEGKKARKK